MSIPASEFEGSGPDRERLGAWPEPHELEPGEELVLLRSDPDDGARWQGLLSEEEQRALREAEGVMRKGKEPYSNL